MSDKNALLLVLSAIGALIALIIAIYVIWSKGSKQIDPRREELLNLLLAKKRRSDETAACETYCELFERLVRPLQTLFSLANEAETRDLTFIQECFVDDISVEVKSALRHIGGKLSFGRPIISKSSMQTDYESFIESTASWSESEIKNAICRYEDETEAQEIWIAMKQICCDLAETLNNIANMTDSSKIDRAYIKNLADVVKSAFKAHGIYVLFVSDAEINTRHDLVARFVPAHQSALKYPGLFIIEDGKLNVLGHFAGLR